MAPIARSSCAISSLPRASTRLSSRPSAIACAALTDCDAVLSSFRPGGFEARVHDERIPLLHDVIGQETQGPGGFFLALRSLHVFRGLVEEMDRHCPRALLVNYTNPVNVVAQAVTKMRERRAVRMSPRDTR